MSLPGPTSSGTAPWSSGGAWGPSPLSEEEWRHPYCPFLHCLRGRLNGGGDSTLCSGPCVLYQGEGQHWYRAPPPSSGLPRGPASRTGYGRGWSFPPSGERVQNGPWEIMTVASHPPRNFEGLKAPEFAHFPDLPRGDVLPSGDAG